MKSAKTHFIYPKEEIKLGHFSKKEAAQAIASGVRHIHSSTLKEKDPLVQTTLAKTEGKNVHYPWEQFTNASVIHLKSSSSQEVLNSEIVQNSKSFHGWSNRDRLQTVLGELTTNFFYHAFKDADGNDKYDRRKSVNLSGEELVHLQYSENAQGIFLRFEDNAGALNFNDLASRLYPCYQINRETKFENKHQGAGLGFYMIFEIVTHLFISIVPQQKTVVSVWLSPINLYQPEFFSFNFFEENPNE